MDNAISLTRWRQHLAQKPFLESNTGTYTYNAAADYISRVAQFIQQFISAEQSIVPMLLPNSPEFVLILLGVMVAGKIPYPLPPTGKPAEIQAKTADLKIQFVICDAISYGLTITAGWQPVTLATIQQFVAQSPHGDRDCDEFDRIPVEAKLICATSGTTGTPKRAVLQVSHMLQNASAHAKSLELCADDRILGCLPFYHVFTLSTHIFSVIHLGATFVVGADTFPQTISDMIQRYAVSYTSFVPAILDAIVRHFDPDLFTLPHLKKVSVGAAPVSVKQLKRYKEFFSQQSVYVTYGLTEAGPRVSTLDVSQTAEYLWDTVGLPLAQTEVRIVDPNAKGIGELHVKAPWPMMGYYGDEAATASLWDGEWLKTGDLAMLTPEGYIRLCGRQKDLIISGGVNISPAEIESMLNHVAWVAEAAVLPVPDRKRGEVPHAFVVRDGHGTETELLSILRSQLDQIKVPRKIHFVERIPKNATGKPDRIALLELYLKHRLRSKESISCHN